MKFFIYLFFNLNLIKLNKANTKLENTFRDKRDKDVCTQNSIAFKYGGFQLSATSFSYYLPICNKISYLDSN